MTKARKRQAAPQLPAVAPCPRCGRVARPARSGSEFCAACRARFACPGCGAVDFGRPRGSFCGGCALMLRLSNRLCRRAARGPGIKVCRVRFALKPGVR